MPDLLGRDNMLAVRVQVVSCQAPFGMQTVPNLSCLIVMDWRRNGINYTILHYVTLSMGCVYRLGIIIAKIVCELDRGTHFLWRGTTTRTDIKRSDA